MKQSKRIAILGAGPIGVEAAARAVNEGHDVGVYEAGEIGEHLRQWGHVELFSPWALNRSSCGETWLGERDIELAPGDEYPSAEEYRTQYLEPLAGAIADDVDFYLGTKVLGVSRKYALKGELLDDPARANDPFLIRVAGPRGIHFDEAEVVIDATGVLSQPNALGPGGLPAIGEEEFQDDILRQIPDLGAEHRAALAGRRVMVVGHGHSALTSLAKLRRLQQQEPTTDVVWVYRAPAEPRPVIDDDPLPERARLDRFGNAVFRDEIHGFTAKPESIIRCIEKSNDGLNVTLQRASDEQVLDVDRLIANVGYRPDTSLYRELQVHSCYASDGPMNLAASLLADSANVDCLEQESGGLDTLETPEPNFFILGAKSYGRNSNFLLRIGFEQIDTIFRGKMETSC